MSQGFCYSNALAAPAIMITVAAFAVFFILGISRMTIPAITMSLLITRNILALIPGIMDKEDLLTAGVVFTAMLAPIFGMSRRYAQIDRGTPYPYPLNDSRLRVDHLWLRVTANVKSAIKTRLADTQRDTNIGSEDRRGEGSSDECSDHQKTFHIKSPFYPRDRIDYMSTKHPL